MSSKKHYFEEPIVRVEISRIRFPRICPVCGSKATCISRLTIAPRKPDYLRYQWAPFRSPQVRLRQNISNTDSKILPIQVCNEHDYTDEGDYRYKSLCIIIDGFTITLMVFGLMFLGDSISRGHIISPWTFAFVGIFLFSMLMTAIAFRPNALARAVRIVGFDIGMQNVLLAFKNQDYRTEFLKENSMSSELVSWIVKT